jgi:hypothetical protein
MNLNLNLQRAAQHQGLGETRTLPPYATRLVAEFGEVMFTSSLTFLYTATLVVCFTQSPIGAEAKGKDVEVKVGTVKSKSDHLTKEDRQVQGNMGTLKTVTPGIAILASRHRNQIISKVEGPAAARQQEKEDRRLV